MNTAKFSKKRLVFDNFSTTLINDVNYNKDQFETTNIYNIKCCDGVLKNCSGIKKASAPYTSDYGSKESEFEYEKLGLNRFRKLYYFKEYSEFNAYNKYRLIVLADDNIMYSNRMFFNTFEFTEVPNMIFFEEPNALRCKIDGKFATLFASSDDDMRVWVTDEIPYYINEISKIKDLCFFEDVLFCIRMGDEQQLWYTYTLDINDIGGTNSGNIDLFNDRGRCEKLIAFNGSLFVFREFGITKISVLGQNKFSITHLFDSTSTIFKDSVAVCGNKVIFMTKDGLYSFNGVSATKLELKFNNLLLGARKEAVAATMQNKYFLAFRTDFNDSEKVGCEASDGYINNALIIIDMETYDFELIRGVDIKHMLPVKDGYFERMYFVFNTGNVADIGQLCDENTLFGQNLKKSLSTDKIFSDSLNKKTIRKLKIDGNAGTIVKVITENGSYAFALKKDGINEFFTIIPCTNFKFCIESNNSSLLINFIEIEWQEN